MRGGTPPQSRFSISPIGCLYYQPHGSTHSLLITYSLLAQELRVILAIVQECACLHRDMSLFLIQLNNICCLCLFCSRVICLFSQYNLIVSTVYISTLPYCINSCIHSYYPCIILIIISTLILVLYYCGSTTDSICSTTDQLMFTLYEQDRYLCLYTYG